MYNNFMLFLLGLELCFQRTNRSIQELRTLQKLDGLIECIFNMHKYVYAEHQHVYICIYYNSELSERLYSWYEMFGIFF